MLLPLLCKQRTALDCLLCRAEQITISQTKAALPKTTAQKLKFLMIIHLEELVRK